MAVMEKETQPSGERRSRYPKEFRRDSPALVIDQQRTVADVARQLGVNDQTVGNCIDWRRVVNVQLFRFLLKVSPKLVDRRDMN
jgi:transposase-like protein